MEIRGKIQMIAFKKKKVRMLTDIEGLCSYGLFLLGLREYSVSQIRTKMTARCESPELVESALEKLQNKNYLSDERKAESILRQYGHREAGGKLAQRFTLVGIDKELRDKIITESTQDLTPEDRVAQCALILSKKYKNYDEDKKDKYTRFLLSRGFGFTIISAALREFKEKVD